MPTLSGLRRILFALGITATLGLHPSPPYPAAYPAASASPSSPPEAAVNPFAGEKEFIDPDSSARKQIKKWQSSHPDWAEELAKIADHSQAEWFTEGLNEVGEVVRHRITRITSAHALPVFVAYNIPRRDCDSYSGGGAPDAETYRRWIRAVARGVGNRKAVVILEPDALSDIDTRDCLSPEEKLARLNLLRDAVKTLKKLPATSVYLDAGNVTWRLPARMAELLRQAGIDEADGFALNVSNFIRNDATLAYGTEISRRVGSKHFVVDTSRNGNGPAPHDEWCNPSDRALGAYPTDHTDSPLCDAYLWIKSPGESDGEGPECHDGPAAGVWWPEYALGLAQRTP